MLHSFKLKLFRSASLPKFMMMQYGQGFVHAHMVSTGEGSILLYDSGVLGLCGGSIPLWIILLVGTKNTVNSPQRLQIYWNRGALLLPKAVLPRARLKQIGGVVIFLRENKILATPLENNDQSAFIARLNNISGGGGGAPYGAAMIVMKFGKTQVGKLQLWKLITLEKFNSGNDCFCKSALWETTSLEHSWPLSATIPIHQLPDFL